ncbi:MAG: LLM class flavin-dependent oxidoreductase [Acidimicrobiales bacterium]
MLSVGVLDQAPVPHGSTAEEALAQTLDLAGLAESLGMSRYWLAEHHNTASLASTSPDVMVAAVAAATSHIRVGAGGVLLSHHSPLRVAESYRTLAALHPGRIDLGVGRASGTDEVTEAALRYDLEGTVEELYARRVLDLVSLLGAGFSEKHRFGGVAANPRPLPESGPTLWVLASSGHSGSTAASMALPLCFAHFITPLWSRQVLADYRRRYQPSAANPAPYAALAVSVVCAPTDSEALHLAGSGRLWRSRPEGAERGPLVSPEEAAEQMAGWDELQRARADQSDQAVIVGSPEKVASTVRALVAEHEVDEVLITTVCHSPAHRVRSYELLVPALAG